MTDETSEPPAQLSPVGRVAGLEYGLDCSPLSDEDRAAIERAEAEIDAGDYVGESELRELLASLRRRGG